MSSTTSGTQRRPPRGVRSGAEHPGPPLAAPLAAAAVAWLTAAVLIPLSIGGGAAPDPSGDPSDVTAYAGSAPGAAGVAAALLVFSGVMLVASGSLLSSRLNFLAPHAPGPHLAGQGAAAAGVLLVTAGASTWASTLPAVREDAGALVAVQAVGFVLGGAAHVAALGVMALGLSVTTLYLARTPRWLSVLGIVVAVVDLSAVVTVAAHDLALVLPFARVTTLTWLVALTAIVPRDRGPRRPPGAVQRRVGAPTPAARSDVRR